jgi:hypothetical protein
MKKILLLFLICYSVNLFSQTEIPYPAFFSEIQDVEVEDTDRYRLTLTLNDQSGRYNGNVLDTTNFVLWQNCGRYVITEIISKFPSEAVVIVDDVAGDGAPILGFCSILQESPILGLGFFISGILDSRNQCALSYYTKEYENVLSIGAYNGVYFQNFAAGDSLHIDTLAKYDRLMFYGNTPTFYFPNIPAPQTDFEGKKIEFLLVNEGQTDTVIVERGGFAMVRVCGNDLSFSPNDTIVFTRGERITFDLISGGGYLRYCPPVIEEIELPQKYRYDVSSGSTSAHVVANGEGVVITQNSGGGEVVVDIPENVELFSISFFLPSSVTSSGNYHIVLNHQGIRPYNTTKNNINLPLVRTGLDNYATASRPNPANISENGGNSANTVTYGVSEFGGGDGSNLTITLINFSLGINQMCRLDFTE